MGNRIGILSFLKKNKEEMSRSFVENGGLLLEELIKTSNGRYRFPIRNFSVKDILTATNNFDEHNHLETDGFYTLYKGSLEGRLVSVKKFKKKYTSLAIRDIAITAQMCIHKNVLKLVGCCLEDEALAIVYEHVEGRILDECIYDGMGCDNRPLSWKCRLRAANEIANVVAYLHTALDRPVVHRDIKPKSFMIDQHGVVKLYDFSLSISIPLGEVRVEDQPCGTRGFLDPEYALSRFVTDKSDVYGFGMLLLVLLSGKYPTDLSLLDIDSDNDSSLGDNDFFSALKVPKYFQNGRLNEIVDPRIFEDGGGKGTDEQELQFHAFAALALKCTQECGDDRPDMIEVGKELRRIERSIHLQESPYKKSQDLPVNVCADEGPVDEGYYEENDYAPEGYNEQGLDAEGSYGDNYGYAS